MRWQTPIGIFIALVITGPAFAKATKKPHPPVQQEKVQPLSPPPAKDRAGSIGPGAMVGTIGSLSVKYWFDNENAADIGVEFLDHAWSVFYADYYYHFNGLFGRGTRFGREVSPYVEIGGGGGFWSRSDECGRWKCHWNVANTGSGNAFFVRLLGGMEWLPRRYSFSVFIEAGPSYLWAPVDGNTIDAALGGRFYF